jgi:hypothetical protein
MTAQPVHWIRAETRTCLIGLARNCVNNEPRAATVAREVVPLIASVVAVNPLKTFFDRLVPALRDGRVGSADEALEELLGGAA